MARTDTAGEELARLGGFSIDPEEMLDPWESDQSYTPTERMYQGRPMDEPPGNAVDPGSSIQQMLPVVMQQLASLPPHEREAVMKITGGMQGPLVAEDPVDQVGVYGMYPDKSLDELLEMGINPLGAPAGGYPNPETDRELEPIEMEMGEADSWRVG